MQNNRVSPVLPVKSSWGSIGGKEVFLFCLKNNRGTSLLVSNFGAAAQGLFFTDRYGRYADILLGYDNLAGYEKDEYYMGTVVGRHANRIAGGEVWIDGQRYTLSTREGGYHLHGGKSGFNKKVFDYDYRLPEAGDRSSIVFSYISHDLEEGFPGNLAVQVTYTLDNEDNWHIEYECRTDKTTLINLTQHAYFNLAGHAAGSVLDHSIMLDSGIYLPVNGLQVPTGDLSPVEGTPFDFTTPHEIGRRIGNDHQQLILSRGYDHSWVLKNERSPVLKRAALALEPFSGRRLEVFTSEPAIHFYTGNYLNPSVVGKGGAIYAERSGFCLETQHYPDAPNQPSFPTTVLKAGERFYSRTIYSLSVEGSPEPERQSRMARV
jgi:aldose 1-epimerase